MARGRAFKLFAVVAFVGACDKGVPAKQQETEQAVRPTQPAVAPLAPRTLSNGSPAVGNTMGKTANQQRELR